MASPLDYRSARVETSQPASAVGRRQRPDNEVRRGAAIVLGVVAWVVSAYITLIRTFRLFGPPRPDLEVLGLVAVPFVVGVAVASLLWPRPVSSEPPAVADLVDGGEALAGERQVAADKAASRSGRPGGALEGGRTVPLRDDRYAVDRRLNVVETAPASARFGPLGYRDPRKVRPRPLGGGKAEWAAGCIASTVIVVFATAPWEKQTMGTLDPLSTVRLILGLHAEVLVIASVVGVRCKRFGFGAGVSSAFAFWTLVACAIAVTR